MSELFLRPLFDWRSAVASKFGPEKPTTRFVLLTLALHMSPKGDSCWPSIDLLSEESGLSRRAVIEHLQLAEQNGWIAKRDRSTRSGQGWRRVEYFCTIPPGIETRVRNHDSERGAPESPPKAGDPSAEGGDRDSKKVVHQGHLSTSKSTSRGNQLPVSAFALPDWIREDVWKAYEEMRKKIRKPMTERARDLIIKKLLEMKQAGQDANAVLEQSVMSSWTGIFPIKTDTSPAGKQQPWWTDDQATLSKAKELGVSTNGISWQQLRSKIREKIDSGQTRH